MADVARLEGFSDSDSSGDELPPPAVSSPKPAPSEGAISSFSCALYRNSLPVQGRLYLSAHHLSFAAWRGAGLRVALGLVSSVERTHTVFFVPNAILVRTAAEDLFFGSFLDRDGCYAVLSELVEVNARLKDILDQPAAPERPLGLLPPPPADAGGITAAMAVLLDAELPATVQAFYHALWGPRSSCFQDFLAAEGDTGVELTPWAAGPAEHPRTGEEFALARDARHEHPRTSMLFVGPPSVATRTRLLARFEGTNPRHDRFTMLMTQTFEGIPLSDAFSVEVRWVATRCPAAGEAPRLRLRVGLEVVFSRFTVFKEQIRRGTVEEGAASYGRWLRRARQELRSGAEAEQPPEEGAVREGVKYRGVWTWERRVLVLLLVLGLGLAHQYLATLRSLEGAVEQLRVAQAQHAKLLEALVG